MSDDTLEPTPKWKPILSKEWLESNEIQKDLFVGLHEVEFSELEEYDKPKNTEVEIQDDQTLTIIQKYLRYIPKANLQIVFEPNGFSDLINASWRIKGTDYWRPSGYVEEKVPIGTYEIEFKDSQYCKQTYPLEVIIEDKKNLVIKYEFKTVGTPKVINEEIYSYLDDFSLTKRTAPDICKITLEGAEDIIEETIIEVPYGQSTTIKLIGSFISKGHSLLEAIETDIDFDYIYSYKLVTKKIYEDKFIKFNIKTISNIKEDFYHGIPRVIRSRRIGGIFVKEDNIYIATSSINSMEKRKALHDNKLSEDFFISSNNTITSSRRKFSTKEEIYISSNKSLIVDIKNKEIRKELTIDQVLFSPIIIDSSIKKTVVIPELISNIEPVIMSSVILDVDKKRTMNYVKTDLDVYIGASNITSFEIHNPSLNLVDNNKEEIYLSSGNIINSVKHNTKIKLSNFNEEVYISSNDNISASIETKIPNINIDIDDIYMSSNTVTEASKNTKLDKNTLSIEEVSYLSNNNFLATKENKLKSTVKTLEEVYISSNIVTSIEVKNHYLIKTSISSDLISFSSDNVINVTINDPRVIKKTTNNEEVYISSNDKFLVEKHDITYESINTNNKEEIYYSADTYFEIEKKVKANFNLVNNDNLIFKVGHIIEVEKRQNYELHDITKEEISYSSSIIYEADIKSNLINYLLVIQERACLLSDDLLSVEKKSHLVNEKFTDNEIYISSNIVNSASKRDHLLKNKPVEDTIYFKQDTLLDITKHNPNLLLINTNNNEEVYISSNDNISASIETKIPNINIDIDDIYMSSNTVEKIDIENKFNNNSSIEEVSYLSPSIEIVEKESCLVILKEL